MQCSHSKAVDAIPATGYEYIRYSDLHRLHLRAERRSFQLREYKQKGHVECGIFGGKIKYSLHMSFLYLKQKKNQPSAGGRFRDYPL